MRRPNARLALAAVLLTTLGVAFAGCGTDTPRGEPEPDVLSPAPATTDVPDPPDEVRPPVSERCAGALGDLRVRERQFSADDGTVLFAVEAGAGPRGVVLVPGTASQGVCIWGEAAQRLVADGFHVLALDQRCQGYSECPGGPGELDLDALAAADELSSRGARRVVVVGESRGGGVALAAAVRDQRVDAAVAVSAVWMNTFTDNPELPIEQLVPMIRVPVLYLSARDDALVSQGAYRAWAATTPQAEYAVWDDGGHGALLLGDPSSDPAPYRRLVQFLERVG